MNQKKPSGTKLAKSSEISFGAKLGISLLMLAIVAGGCFPLYLGVQAIREARDSQTWPTTKGKITRSLMDVKTSTSKDSKGRVTTSHSYHADVQYQYKVAEVAHTGTKVTVMSGIINTRAAAQAVLDKYPLNAEVTVAYDPNNVDEALLEPGDWWGAIAPLSLATLLIGIPLLILKGIWSSSSPDQKASTPDRVLGGAVFRERILEWKPGEKIHVHRDHETLRSIVIGSLFIGLFGGLIFGLIPALMFFSGRGNAFVAKFYFIVSGLLAVGFAIPYGRAHRRRDFQLDWGLQSLRVQIGWSAKQLSFDHIKALVLRIGKSITADKTDKSLLGRIELEFEDTVQVLLETDLKGNDRGQLRSLLQPLIESLAKELKVPWAAKELNASSSESKPDTSVASYRGQYAELAQAIEKVGGKVECRGNEVHGVDLSAIAGTDGIVEIVSQISTIERLVITGKEVTDAGVAQLAKLEGLSHLSLDDTSITDEGVAHLAALEELESLSLCGTAITNEALRVIAKMSWLDEVELARTKIDDVGLSHFNGSNELFHLNVQQTRVTSDGLQRFRELCPDCEIAQD